MNAGSRAIRATLLAMNLYKPNHRIDSQHYKGIIHPRKNLRPWLKPCWRRIATDDQPCRGSFSSDGLKRYRTGSDACVGRPGGDENRRVSPCDTKMNTTPRQNTTEKDDSFTSFTSAVFAEVNKIIDRRQPPYPLSFTSFTSFSEVCGIHAGGRPRGRAHFSLTPLRDPSERSEREGATTPPSVDSPVHFASFEEVNERVSFTSEGILA